MFRLRFLTVAAFAALLALPASSFAELIVERVTTKAPFPRGLVMKDGKLYVLCRGRVRSAGGVSAEVNDQAGTIYVVDPNVSEPVTSDVGEAVRNNGEVFAQPTSPPFNLWDRSAVPAERDRETDRPYCTLRYDEKTSSFYICAFSGIDKPKLPGKTSFSKNLTDAIFRYDTRTNKWYVVERHNIEAGGSYPHHDPEHYQPPHGWLNGPDNCLVLGDILYGVSKDNSLLVAYDLRDLQRNSEAGPPQSRVVMTGDTWMKDGSRAEYRGQSALAYHDGYLYIAYRTSSVILRVPVDSDMNVIEPIGAELVARFDPFHADTATSANVTDMGFDEKGRLYVISAQPSRVFRFTPDPSNVYDARNGRAEAWADLSAVTYNPQMKSENVLYADGWVYVTSGDGYGYQQGADGTVYRVKVTD